MKVKANAKRLTKVTGRLPATGDEIGEYFEVEFNADGEARVKKEVGQYLIERDMVSSVKNGSDEPDPDVTETEEG